MEDTQVDTEVMIKKIKVDDYEKMDSEEKKQAFQWFLQFVRESDTVEGIITKFQWLHVYEDYIIVTYFLYSALR